MKTLAFVLMLIPCIVVGQHKLLPPHLLIKEEYKLAEMYSQCHYSAKYNAKQRRSFFPFSTAATIKLVSFIDTVRIYKPIAVDNFEIDYNKVFNSKTLSAAGIDSLTDIMYNVGFTPVNGSYTVTVSERMCYNPRNAILFIDANGTVTQYIEFCFECHRYYLSSRKIKNAIYCEQKYDLLSNFFLLQGAN